MTPQCEICGSASNKMASSGKSKSGKIWFKKYCGSCSSRLHRYKLSKEQLKEMINNPSCSICKEELIGRDINIDHCHTSGIVRGVLCGRCNLVLGQARDNIKILFNSIKYLKRCQDNLEEHSS